MKNLWIILLMASLIACGNTKKEDSNATTDKKKDKEIPSVVMEKFAALYPSVTNEKWDEEDANFEAEFEVDKVETSVVFNASGTLLETETALEPSELPDAAKKYCSDNMSGKKIKEAAKIVDASNVITYEAEVDGADYIFDADGKFIKKVVENDEKDNEEND